MSLKIALAAVVLSVATSGCTSTILGKGGDGQSGTDPSSQGPTTDGNGTVSNEPSAADTAESSSNGNDATTAAAPSDVEVLFGPPTNETMTPDKILGLWASQDSMFEYRLLFASKSVTAAVKRPGDGKIAFVKVTAKVSDQSIQIVESKTAKLASAYTNGEMQSAIEIKLAITSTSNCKVATSSDCFQIIGSNALFPFAPATGNEWIKLSD
jgi:hypothetical protein